VGGLTCPWVRGEGVRGEGEKGRGREEVMESVLFDNIFNYIHCTSKAIFILVN